VVGTGGGGRKTSTLIVSEPLNLRPLTYENFAAHKGLGPSNEGLP
jgi:hypothetical protein